MQFGEINPVIKMQHQLLPPRGPNTYTSGLKDGDKAIDKFGPPSTKHPNLIIVNPISDDDRNIIMPGYYELILSSDKTMLSLAQGTNIIATVPVFKIEEDKTQEDPPAPRTYWALQKYNREQKKKEKKMKKLIRDGKMSGEPQIYTNATIEHVIDGNYYLIKYERGKIRAWGAIK